MALAGKASMEKEPALRAVVVSVAPAPLFLPVSHEGRMVGRLELTLLASDTHVVELGGKSRRSGNPKYTTEVTTDGRTNSNVMR